MDMRVRGSSLETPRRGSRGLLPREARRGGEHGRGGHEDALAAAHVDLLVDVVGDEVLAERARGLGLAEHEVAAFPQREGEEVEGTALEVAREVDEDVAAQHEVEVRERGALAEVVLAEDGEVADALLHLVAAVERDEVAVDELVRQVLDGGRPVDPAAGEGDRLAVDVGREDADVEAVELVAEQLADQDGERVCLLAGGAPGRPDPQRLVVVPGVGDERGQDHVPEVREELRIAHELGDLDEEAVDQPLVLLGVLGEVVHVLVEGVGVRGRHPAPEPAQDGRLLVFLEVDPAPLAHEIEERVKWPVLVRGGLDVGPRQEIAQDAPDAVEIGHDIDGGRGERVGHAPESRGVGVLDDHRAAAFLHVAGAGAAVGAVPGQDDGDEVLAEDLGRAAEERVDGRLGPRVVLRRKPELVVGDLDVAARGHDVDDALLDGGDRGDGADGQLAAAAQEVGEVALPPRVEVLGDDDRGRERGPQAGDERAEGLDAAGGAADHDELRSGVGFGHGSSRGLYTPGGARCWVCAVEDSRSTESEVGLASDRRAVRPAFCGRGDPGRGVAASPYRGGEGRREATKGRERRVRRAPGGHRHIWRGVDGIPGGMTRGGSAEEVR
ncbi:hypothetical protein WME85_26990 [Sorangium sp. So ce1153]